MGSRHVATFSLRPINGIRVEISVAAGHCEFGHHSFNRGVESVARKIKMLHLIVFSVFGLVCVAGAVNLLVQRHPINSALSLVVVMGSLAVEYLLLGAEFVAAVQV